MVEEVLHGEVAQPVRARGQIDHRHSTILGEDSAQGGDVVTQEWGSESLR